MKNKKIVAAILSGTLLAGAGVASAYKFTRYAADAPRALNIPATPDSTEKENPFKAEKLLDARMPLSLRMLTADWTTMQTDSAGNLELASTKDNRPSLHTFMTRLRSPRYAEGKLILSSNSIANVRINGKSLLKKNSADSLPCDVSASLELQPEADYEVQIDIIGMPDDKATPAFSLEFVPDEKFKDVEVAAAPDMQRRFAPVTTMIGERATSASLSPDGKYLITKFSETFSANETTQRARITETATGKIVAADIDPSSQWMPRGTSYYHTIKKPAGYDLISVAVPSMETEVIARNMPEQPVIISPDGKYVLYYQEAEGKSDDGVMRRVKSPDDRIPGDRDRSYLMLYNLENHLNIPLTYGGSSTFIADYSRDGSQLLYLSQRQDPSNYPFYFSDLIKMDMTTLSCDTIIRDNGYITNAIFSPDNRKLFILGGPQTFGDLGVNAGNHPIPNAFDGQGFIYDIKTGKTEAVTREFNPAIVGNPVWNPVDNRIYFMAEEGFFTPIFALDPDSRKITKLPTSFGSVKNFSIGDNQKNWLVYTGGDFDNTGVEALINLRTNKSTIIANPMKETLDGIEFGKMDPWKFKASDGTEIDGYRCLPPDFDPSKKYPLIVYYYGGTSPSTAAMYHLYSPQVFASRDYVVYVVNPSGTTGYGQEFSSRHVNTWGQRTADDIIEGVKKFCDAHPYVDRSKIGCIGASYGGFMTQYLLTLTDIFSAAVSHAGISNVTSYWGEGFWGYSYNSVAAAKSYPWTNPKLYTEQGSLFNADKIHTPLLLLHGKLDTNVPIGESIQIFNALRVLGRDVELITVEDENHVISNFDRKQLWQNTIMAWFAKYLQDDPRWWDALYGE